MATTRSTEVERIVFEPAEDGKRWRMRLEGGDVEGHHANYRFRAMEPSGEDEQTGEALYRLTLEMDGEDVEAHHGNFRFARPDDAPEAGEVEGHSMPEAAAGEEPASDPTEGSGRFESGRRHFR